MATHDLDIANQTGNPFRTDLNAALKALGSLMSASSAPTISGGLQAGNVWLDTTSNPYALKVYNGTAWATLLTIATGGSPTVTVAGVGSVVQGYDANTAKRNAVQSWSKQQHFAAGTITDGATITWNLDDAQVGTVTLGGNRTMGTPTGGTVKDGGVYTLRVKQDGTGGRTLAWNSVFKFIGGAPTISTAANAMDIFVFVGDGSGNMHCVGMAQGF